MSIRFVNSACAAILLLTNGLGMAAGFGGVHAARVSRMSCCHQSCCSSAGACASNGECRMAMPADDDSRSASADRQAAAGAPGPCLHAGRCGAPPAMMASPNLDPAVVARSSSARPVLLASGFATQTNRAPASRALPPRDEPPRA
jgi:hypothetical protein